MENFVFLQTFRHDAAQTLKCNLFGNILRLDVFILFCDNNSFAHIFPAVLFDPELMGIVCKKTKKFSFVNKKNSSKNMKINTINTSKQSFQIFS